jgi:hypothetical protein
MGIQVHSSQSFVEQLSYFFLMVKKIQKLTHFSSFSFMSSFIFFSALAFFLQQTTKTTIIRANAKTPAITIVMIWNEWNK